MDNKENFNKDLGSLRELVKKEIESAWRDGYKEGVISTCAVLHKTFTIAGLEPNNMLFKILEDVAEKHGCNDLQARIAKLKGDK